MQYHILVWTERSISQFEIGWIEGWNREIKTKTKTSNFEISSRLFARSSYLMRGSD
jgi:hypothetical protein